MSFLTQLCVTQTVHFLESILKLPVAVKNSQIFLEMLVRTPPTTLLEIFSEIMLIWEYIKDPDDTTLKIFRHLWVNVQSFKTICTLYIEMG